MSRSLKMMLAVPCVLVAAVLGLAAYASSGNDDRTPATPTSRATSTPLPAIPTNETPTISPPTAFTTVPDEDAP